MKPVSAVAVVAFLSLGLTANAVVIGIDFGADWFKVALVKPGKIPIQVVLNEASKRKSPSNVGLNGDELHVGDTAMNLAMKKPHFTFPHVKPLMGRMYNPEYLQKFGTFYHSFEIVKHEERGVFGLKYAPGADQNETVFQPEEIYGLILSNAKSMSEDMAGSSLKDCVITVPTFYTHDEKAAILDAAELVGLNVLALLNDHTAIALKYGIDGNSDSFPEGGQNVIFYDMGAASTKVSLVNFGSEPDKDRKNKTVGNLAVLATAWDTTLGGSAFTGRVYDLLAKASKRELSTPRMQAKMMKEAEKVKTVLSANTEIGSYIEGLVDDYDFKSSVKRAELEEASADLLARVSAPIAQVLKEADVKPENVHAIEIVGGAVRIPAVQSAIKKFMNREELQRGLDGDEAACLGSALYAASLSTAFRLRKFGVKEVSPFPVSVDVFGGSDSEAKNYKLFKRYNIVPSKKVMTFKKKDDFSFMTKYDPYDEMEVGAISEIARYTVMGVANATAKNPNATSTKVNVNFRLNRNGMVEVEKAELVVESEVMVEIVEEEPKKKKAAKKIKNATANGTDSNSTETDEETNATEDASNGTSTDEAKPTDEKPADADAQNTTNTTEPQPKKEKKYKPQKRVHRVALKIEIEDLGVPAMSAAQKKVSKALIKDIKARDQALKDRAAMQNTLESFIYDTKERLESNADKIGTVTTPEQIEKLQAEIALAETWLFEGEADNAKTADFSAKYDVLRDMKDAIYLRIDEAEARPGAITAARDLLNNTKWALADVTTTKPWINETVKTPAYESLARYEKWLNESIDKQDALKPSEPPAFYVKDLIRKFKDMVEYDLNVVMHKPKPLEPKKEKVKLRSNQTGSNETADNATDIPEFSTTSEDAKEEGEAKEGEAKEGEAKEGEAKEGEAKEGEEGEAKSEL